MGRIGGGLGDRIVDRFDWTTGRGRWHGREVGYGASIIGHDGL